MLDPWMLALEAAAFGLSLGLGGMIAVTWAFYRGWIVTGKEFRAAQRRADRWHAQVERLRADLGGAHETGDSDREPAGRPAAGGVRERE